MGKPNNIIITNENFIFTFHVDQWQISLECGFLLHLDSFLVLLLLPLLNV